MVEAKIKNLVVGIVLLIVLIVILAGLTPTVLDALDNLSGTLVDAGLSIGSLLAVSSLGGILWFLLVLLIILGTIFLMIKGAGSSK